MENVKELKLEQIVNSRNNPRQITNEKQIKELIDSVKIHGVLQPIVVRVIGKNKKAPFDEVFEIVCGHRRYAAAVSSALDTIPCVVKELTDSEALEIGIVENLQREDVNAMDEAAGIAALMKANKNDIRAVASKLGKSESYIAGRMKLLKLPAEVQKAIQSAEISPAHGAVISRLTDIGQQKELLKAIKEEKLSVRAAENQLRDFGGYLRDVPFNTDDCIKCEHNGAKIKDFFDKDTDLEGKCLNLECLSRKMKEWVVKKKADIEKKGGVLLTQTEADKKFTTQWRYNNNEIDASDKKQLGKKYREKCEHCEKHAFILKESEYRQENISIKEICLNSKCFNARSKTVAEDKDFQTERNDQRNENKTAARCTEVMRQAWQGFNLNQFKGGEIFTHAFYVLIYKTVKDTLMGCPDDDNTILKLWKKTDPELAKLTQAGLQELIKDQYDMVELSELAAGLKFDPVKHLTLNDTYWTTCSKPDLLALAKKLGVKDLTESDKRSEMITKVKAAVKPGFVPDDIKKYIKELK